MEERIIESITEAFSMQPRTLAIWILVENLHNPNNFGKDKNSIEEIRHEKISDECWGYVGYNFDGKALFKYLANSVNVHYKT